MELRCMHSTSAIQFVLIYQEKWNNTLLLHCLSSMFMFTEFLSMSTHVWFKTDKFASEQAEGFGAVFPCVIVRMVFIFVF